MRALRLDGLTRRFGSHRADGQAIVETAVVLPVLLLLLLGIIQFGFIFHSYVTLEEAARVGVRAWADGQATTQAMVQSEVSNAMPSLIPSDIGTVQLCVNNGPCSGTAYASLAVLPDTPGTPLEVVATYTQPILVPPFDAVFGSRLTLTSAVVMEGE